MVITYQAILTRHAIVIKRLDEKKSYKGADNCQTYMSVQHLVLAIANVRTTGDPEWSRVSFRAVGATEGYAYQSAYSLYHSERFCRKSPLIIGGKAFIYDVYQQTILRGWVRNFTPCSNKGTYFSNGSRAAVKLSTDSCWAAFSCQQAEVVSWTKLPKAQEDAIYHLHTFVSITARNTILKLTAKAATCTVSLGYFISNWEKIEEYSRRTSYRDHS